jgi:hypothetical protein
MDTVPLAVYNELFETERRASLGPVGAAIVEG